MIEYHEFGRDRRVAELVSILEDHGFEVEVHQSLFEKLGPAVRNEHRRDLGLETGFRFQPLNRLDLKLGGTSAAGIRRAPR